MATNAYPRVNVRGTNDKSLRQVPYKTTSLPQFLPLVFVMSRKGPTTRQVVNSSLAINLYGKEIFDSNSKYFKHTNQLLKTVLSNSGVAVVHRLVDPVVKERSNITLYLDILEDDIDVYKRHIDGSIVYDDNGEPVVDEDNSPFKGYRVKWIVEYTDGSEEYGTKTVKTGTMEDADGNKSTMYPIFEFRAADVGEYGNDLGFAFATADINKVSKEDLEKFRTFPLYFYYYRKDNETRTPRVFPNIYNGPNITFALNPKAKHPITNEFLDISRILDKYYTEDEYKEILKPYFYADNADLVLTKLYEKEKEWYGKDIETEEGTVNTSEWYDFIEEATDDENKYMLNPVSFRTLSRVPYFGFVHDKDEATLSDGMVDVTLGKNLPLFMKGGKDGKIDDETFESLVREQMDLYLQVDGPYMDPLVNVETVLVDSGFGVETKKSLVNFIALRHDTFLILSTYVKSESDKPFTLEEERAIAVALNSRCQLAPESEEYGTPVMRAMIVAGSGRIKSDVNLSRYPLTLDITEKSCSFMGASGAKWNKNKLFDRGELNIIKSMIDIEPKFVPETVKANLWSINMVYPEPIDRSTYCFTALQTVYPDDTSVLNSYFTAMAIVWIYKVAYEAHRRFSGSVSLPDKEFLKKVDSFIMSKLDGAFGDMFKVEATSYLTENNELEGYSWSTDINIYSPTMKTEMQLTVNADRL